MALALTVAGVAFATSNDTHPAQHQPTDNAAPAVNVVASVAPEIAANLSVFRTGAKSAETGLPGDLASVFDDELTRRTGANPALAREIETDSGPFYIVPAEGQICQLGGGGVACGSTGSLGEDPRGYMLISRSRAYPDDTIMISGIADDHVEGITALSADGGRTAVSVADNAYASLVPADSVAIEFTTDRGAVIAPVTQPSEPTP